LLNEGCREQVALADERATEAAVGELGAGNGCNARQAGRQQEFDCAAAEVGAERCAADGIAAVAGCHARFAAIERAGRARRRVEERTAAAGVGRAVADAAQGAAAAGPAAIVAKAAALAGQRRQLAAATAAVGGEGTRAAELVWGRAVEQAIVTDAAV
jgi:hypothetical protein